MRDGAAATAPFLVLRAKERTLMKRLLCSLLLLSSTAAQAATGGIGDLLVTPTRIVLDRRTRTAEIALINTGNVAATYRIETQHMRMRENGDLAVVDDEPAEAFADALVQFSPRRVVLQPHVAQTVRLRLRTPPPSGELYLHLLFHGEPPEEASATAADPKALLIKVTPIYGVAVPVLVRPDGAEAAVRIENVHLADGGTLTFRLARSGNQSTYGNLAVVFRPRSGRERQLAAKKGISVYAPLTVRGMTMRLPDGAVLRDGTLEVTYVDAERAGAPVLATLDLP
jgi:P pilus assembly chaperone PapD